MDQTAEEEMVVGGDLYFLFFPGGTNGEPDATNVAGTANIAGIEDDVPRVARIARIERRGPVVAAGTGIAEIRVAPATGSGKENAVAVRGGKYSSTYSCTVIVCRPSPCALGP